MFFDTFDIFILRWCVTVNFSWLCRGNLRWRTGWRMYPRTFQKYKKSTRPYCQFQRSSEFYLEIFAHVRMQLLNCDFSYKKGSIQNIISCGFWKKSFRFLVHILSKTFYQLPNALPQPFFVALVLTQKLTSISVHVQISTSNRETAVYTG